MLFRRGVAVYDVIEQSNRIIGSSDSSYQRCGSSGDLGENRGRIADSEGCTQNGKTAGKLYKISGQRDEPSDGRTAVHKPCQCGVLSEKLSEDLEPCDHGSLKMN